MTRPVLPFGDGKSETIRVRVSPAQRFQLEHAAALAGMSLSELVRQLLLDSPRTVRKRVQAVRDSRGLDPQTLMALTKLGVNLNQIARVCNARQSPPPTELTVLCRKIEEILDETLRSNPKPT